MKINRFVFWGMLCSAMMVFAGPVGDIIFNNDIQDWHLLITYKVNGNSVPQKIKIQPKGPLGSAVISIVGLESLTIEADSVNPWRPTANDGKKIMSEIEKNKAQLTGKKTVDVIVSLKNGAIDTNVKITKGSSDLPDIEESKKPATLPYDQLSDESYVKQQISKKYFDAFVAPIPANHRMKIVQKAVNQLAKDAGKDPKKLNEQELFGLLNQFFAKLNKPTPLYLIAKAYDFTTSMGSGYVIFSSDLMKGERTENNWQWQRDHGTPPLLKQYYNDSLKGRDVKALIPVMFGSYKIHLMPTKDDRFETVIKLIEAIKNNSTLQNTISSFKVAEDDLPYQQASKNSHTEQNAVVVIYAAGGKKDAQKALKELYDLFKGTKGLNVRPRYNAKVTDLIWVAQGDADVKGGSWEKYYDKDGIYYKPDEFGRSASEDLKLKHPSTGKDLVDIK